MSTLTVSTINTANATTDLTLRTGNSSGPGIIFQSNGVLVLQSNSSANLISLNSTAVSITSLSINALSTNAINANTSTVVGTSTLNGLSVGYLEIPQVNYSTNYTAVLSDSGKHIYHPSTDNNARTYTIPSNASVPYPIGTVLTFINAANNVTIAINSDTMYLAGQSANTGSRTLGSYGLATAVKITSTSWVISGTNLT